MAGGDQSRRLLGHQRHVIVGGFTAPKPCQPHALLRELQEIRSLEAGLQDHRAGDHAHAARPVVGKAALRRERQRLDALGVLRPARHVDLGGRDRGRRAAVEVAFEIADGALARRVVAEGDMDVRVDQPGDRRHAAGVDHHVGGVHRLRRRGADRHDALAVADDGVALGERIAPIAETIWPRLTIATFIVACGASGDGKARREIVGRHQAVDHTVGAVPIEGAVAVAGRHKARAGVEHLILGVARAELRADRVPRGLQELHLVLRLELGRALGEADDALELGVVEVVRPTTAA